MKLKILNQILSFIFAVNLFVVLLFAALVPTAMNRNFYYNQFAINQSYQKAFTNETTLNNLIDHTLDYTYGNKDQFQIQITLLDGRVINAFTETEVKHMDDVQRLFINGRILTLFNLISLVLIGSWFLINYRKFELKNFKIMSYTILAILGVALLLLAYAAIDFSTAFVIFHEIFFSNDYWILYSTDYLIIMLPEVLFFRLALRIILALIVYLSTVLFLLNKFANKKQERVKAK